MILDFLQIAANLKTVPRQGWIDKLLIKTPESVADHSFLMAVMGMVLSDLEHYNTEKILKMIILHDLAESVIGDLTPEQKLKKEKKELENKTMLKILTILPNDLQDQYIILWNEFQKNESSEAKFVHQIDKLEMSLQAKIYSKKINSTEKIQPFLESAKLEINHPYLLNLFKRISSQ
jgi:putative hydrolase of HD superfamily